MYLHLKCRNISTKIQELCMKKYISFGLKTFSRVGAPPKRSLKKAVPSENQAKSISTDYEEKIKEFEQTYGKNSEKNKKTSFVKTSDLESNPTKDSVKNEENVEQLEKQVKLDQLELIPSNIDNMLQYMYTNSKNYTLLLEKFKDQFEKKDTLNKYYTYLMENIKILRKHQLHKLIKIINYYQIKDYKALTIYEKLLEITETNTKHESALTVIYSAAKLGLCKASTKENEVNKQKAIELIKKCYEILIQHESLIGTEKSHLVPFFWALSEINLFDEKVFSMMDEYVKENIDTFNEYEVSITFRSYSKLYYMKYDTLGLLIKKSIEFIDTMSLRYMLILSKCLASLNIKNEKLLNGLNTKLLLLIEKDKKIKTPDPDNDDYIDANFLAQILNSFVKLKVVDYETYEMLENLFFKKCEVEKELISVESISSIFICHCQFYKRLFFSYEVNHLGQIEEKKEQQVKSKQRPDVKQLKYFKILQEKNEIFFEKFLSFLDIFKDKLNLKAFLNILILSEKTNIKKRKNLRSFLEIYLFIFDKFLKEKSEQVSSDEVNSFIEYGFRFFYFEQQKDKILAKIEESNLELSESISKLISGIKLQKEEKKKRGYIEPKKRDNVQEKDNEIEEANENEKEIMEDNFDKEMISETNQSQTQTQRPTFQEKPVKKSRDKSDLGSKDKKMNRL